MKHLFSRFVSGRYGTRVKVCDRCGISMPMSDMLNTLQVTRQNAKYERALHEIASGQADPILHAYKALRK